MSGLLDGRVPRWQDEKRRAVCSSCPAPCCMVARPRLESFDPLYRYKNNMELLPGRAEPRLTLRRVNGRCVYLSGHGHCLAYHNRPIACRVWFCGKGTEDETTWNELKEEVMDSELIESAVGLRKAIRASEPTPVAQSNNRMIRGRLTMLTEQVELICSILAAGEKVPEEVIENYAAARAQLDEQLHKAVG